MNILNYVTKYNLNDKNDIIFEELKPLKKESKILLSRALSTLRFGLEKFDLGLELLRECITVETLPRLDECKNVIDLGLEEERENEIRIIRDKYLLSEERIDILENCHRQHDNSDSEKQKNQEQPPQQLTQRSDSTSAFTTARLY